MRRVVAWLLAVAVLLPAPLASAREPIAPPSALGSPTDGRLGPIAAAAAREAAALRTPADDQPVRQNAENWVARHPILGGTLLGAAGGLLAGATAAKLGDGSSFVTREDVMLLCTAVGAGIGFVLGVIAAAVK